MFGINVTCTGSAKQTHLHVVCSGNSVETYSLRKGLRVNNVTILFSLKSTLAPHSMSTGAKGNEWKHMSSAAMQIQLHFNHNTLLKTLPLAIFNEDLFHFMVYRKTKVDGNFFQPLEGGIGLYLFIFLFFVQLQHCLPDGCPFSAALWKCSCTFRQADTICFAFSIWHSG